MLETQLRGERDLSRVLKVLHEVDGAGKDGLDIAVMALEGHKDALLLLSEIIARDLSTATVLEEPGAPVIDRGGVKNWMTRGESGVYQVRDKRPGYENSWYPVEGLYPFAMALLDLEEARHSRRGILVEEIED